MFRDDFMAMAGAASVKSGLLKKNPAGYFLSSMLAGVFVGFGILLIFTIGGQLSGQPYTKIIMGAAFGIALSLVIMAGAELFTGNNLVMAAGSLTGGVKWGDTAKLWAVCYIGNWLGAALLALAFFGTGLLSGDTAEFIASSTAVKMSLPPGELFFRGMLCNALVCLAVWMTFRTKSDAAKLIMVFWCLFAFITTGFEHSIANMTLLTAGMLSPAGAAVSMGGYFYNILLSTLGNMAGGIVIVALPYFIISRKRD
ncbi:formate/nitrite transporter family protein [Christensenellaceae bacterium OttesenSCG-928-K19]|nr:formate/nitrite transporter family protein [Christensenellaceae bacterium OttesenSCG-928-K19]